MELQSLLKYLAKHCRKVFYKVLSPNDNSKNQVYLGGDFSVLNLMPFGAIETCKESISGSKRDRLKAPLEFAWLNEKLAIEDAKYAQLILYPKYPEVRFSGFLKGCKGAPREVMTTREPGRVLLFGITNEGKVIGWAGKADAAVSQAILKNYPPNTEVIFNEIDLTETNHVDGQGTDLEDETQSIFKPGMFEELKRIHQKGWINSCRLNSEGLSVPYKAVNGGGYTLEAELGITPNGISEPDYMGWEVKQNGVSNLLTMTGGGAVTLMTPEPDEGYYKSDGVEAFVKKYGYPDLRGREGRINFGGIYREGTRVERTGLTLKLVGFNKDRMKIEDVSGGIYLFDPEEKVAAGWTFASVLEHWNRKHHKAVYVPSLRATEKGQNRYKYGRIVKRCEGTDFSLFLREVANQNIYLDPAVKVENENTSKPKIKRRNQFRISWKNVVTVYNKADEKYDVSPNCPCCTEE